MRSLALFVLVSTSTLACTASVPASGPSYDSVRDRMEHAPAPRLFIGSTGSTGAITAQRYTPSGWQAGNVALAITSGELVARADDRGTLALDHFEVAIAPIEIPQDVFGKPAQLQDLKVKLVSPTVGDTQWSGEDSANANLDLRLDLEWAIAINGGVTPLGTQHLPAIPVVLSLSGDGETVDASIGLAATGDLWSWAGLIRLTALQLSLAAQTVD